VAAVVGIYAESKEKIDFGKISGFVEGNLGFTVKLKRLKHGIVQSKGLLYNPIATGRLFEKIRFKKSDIDILITDKLIATYEDADRRLHVRAAVFGYPSVISTSGIVEAPAKPKAYYLRKQKYSLLRVWELKEGEVKKVFRDRFIDYHDKRMPEVLKGFVSQAILFNLTGSPFCEKKTCRLFNAHWQEDLIRAQVRSGKFCKTHQQELKSIKEEVGYHA
jgi:hypothetical protein